jgi:hypothetical protein
MNCKKCGHVLYKDVRQCMFCGYCEYEEKAAEDKATERFTVSKNGKINELYIKIFGYTDKKLVFKLFKFLLLILFIIFVIYHFFFYVDVRNGCYVVIKPALLEMSNTTMKKGLVYLKKNFPSQYGEFCENVNTINPNISCGGFGGGCFYHNSPKTIDISTTYGNYINAAKVIIHETCHVIQLKEGRPANESECYADDSVIPWNRN